MLDAAITVLELFNWKDQNVFRIIERYINMNHLSWSRFSVLLIHYTNFYILIIILRLASYFIHSCELEFFHQTISGRILLWSLELCCVFGSIPRKLLSGGPRFFWFHISPFFQNIFGTVSSSATTICITVNMLHEAFSFISLGKFKYLSIFLLFYIFALWSALTEKSKGQVLFLSKINWLWSSCWN